MLRVSCLMHTGNKYVMSGKKEESEKAGSSAVSIQYPFMKHSVPHVQDI